MVTSPSRWMSVGDRLGEVVERVAVEVHVAAEADDPAVLAQGGELGGASSGGGSWPASRARCSSSSGGG